MRHVFELLLLAVVLVLTLTPLIGFEADVADQFAAAVADIVTR